VPEWVTVSRQRRATARTWIAAIARAALALGLACLAGPGWAQSDPELALNLPGNLPAPLPGALASIPPLSALCSDRPGKTAFACTVDARHWQYEADIANGSFMSQDGASSDTWILLNPTVKYGLSQQVDLEASLAPLQIVRTAVAGQQAHTIAGIGDLYLKVKYEFVNAHDGDLQIGAFPYVKLPTAQTGIGNGGVEIGMLLPAAYRLNPTFTLSISPELDLYRNLAGGGQHPNTAHALSLAIALPRNVSAYGEVWADWNFDPSGTVVQSSADLGLSYGPSTYLQFDLGLNFGLTDDTPDVQAYIGIAQKF
jgi:hypothetical protein